MSKEKKLTQKQEMFCDEYIKNGGNGTKAYRAVYKTDASTDETIHQNASRMLARPHVLARINILKENLAKKHEIDRDYMVTGLKRAAELAFETGDPGNARGAYMDMAKICGIIDAKTNNVTINSISIQQDRHNIIQAFLERNREVE